MERQTVWNAQEGLIFKNIWALTTFPQPKEMVLLMNILWNWKRLASGHIPLDGGTQMISV